MDPKDSDAFKRAAHEADELINTKVINDSLVAAVKHETFKAEESAKRFHKTKKKLKNIERSIFFISK